MLKHQPCAYCGTKLVDRTKGHVFPQSMYPDSMPNVNRITVPECYSCKAIWEDAEPHFKNTLLAIWNPDELPNDSRVQSMWRGINEKDGRRRARDLASQFRTVEIGGAPRTKVYPDEDPTFNLILRRIVRGLIHKHRALRHSVWNFSLTIHHSSRARWSLWTTRYPELSTNPRGGV